MDVVAAETLPALWSLIPFITLLGLIALAPLWFGDWWARHYPKVAFTLAALILGYYFLALGKGHSVGHAAVEYFSFISLIGSLYVVSGGIVLKVRGEATPLANTIFLGVGAVLANLVGTTGASMLLIRPWLRMNKYRVTQHHVVFFIFVVSNVGGCLTPIGDPPLYIGYLLGIPFWWVGEHLWPIWITGVGVLLAMFYLVDRRNYLRAPREVRTEQAEGPDEWQCQGALNFFWLAVILGAVFVKEPPFLRETLMLGAACGSYFTTPKRLHQANAFNWHPVQEVAILFVGIFATMIPALELLEANARAMGTPTPGLFFWASGGLSSVLDNAPTYLCFLKTTFGAFIDPDTIRQVEHLVTTHGADAATYIHGAHTAEIRNTWDALNKYHAGALAAGKINTDQIEVAYLLGNTSLNHLVLAISAGAVFFGANTYIGNGPNFMVKSIAEHAGVKTPTFLGYIGRFTLPYMLPMLALVWWLFFR